MFFAINNTTSPSITLNYGVPRGSSISPILFIIYVSELPSPIHDYNVHRSQFADDICDFTSAKHTRFIQQQLKNSIDQITTHSGIYRIGLNAGKRHTSEKNIKHVTINNTNISIHNKAKFLGVTFDSSLSFKTHVNLTASKAKSCAYTRYIINHTAIHPPPCFAYTKRSFALSSNTATSLPSPRHPKT